MQNKNNLRTLTLPTAINENIAIIILHFFMKCSLSYFCIKMHSLISLTNAHHKFKKYSFLQ